MIFDCGREISILLDFYRHPHNKLSQKIFSNKLMTVKTSTLCICKGFVVLVYKDANMLPDILLIFVETTSSINQREQIPRNPDEVNR